MSEQTGSLPDHFHASVRRAPGRPAIRTTDTTLTYAEVDTLAGALAHTLRADGARPRRVAILGERVADYHIGYLAALYSGAAVVPLNIEHPTERIAGIAAAASLDAVLHVGPPDEPTVTEPLAAISTIDPSIRCLPISPGTGYFRDEAIDPARLAYILFTSGSSGRPKGVPITHGNVGAYLTAMNPRYGFGPGDVFSQSHELGFDLSVFELWLAWANAACLCPLSRLQALNPAGVVAELGITVFTATPSLISVAAARGALPPGSLSGVRHVVFCGEPLTEHTAAAAAAAAPGAVVDNLYGPTELTVSCTAYRWSARPSADDPHATVQLGEPNQGMHIMLLDPDATGTGELCVRGGQMFGGYLDPAEDRNKFVDRDGHRWYRTGDQVRADKSGLRFLRRLDNQVKVSGYRIELGEVEHAVRKVTGVTDCVAVDIRDEQGPCLALFTTDPTELTPRSLRAALHNLLPPYMVPRHCWQLAELPLTTNGKTNRAHLRDIAANLLTDTQDGGTPVQLWGCAPGGGKHRPARTSAS